MPQWPPILVKVQPHQRVQVTKRSSGTFAFKEGREEVADEPRSGRPTTARTDENVDRELDVLRTDRRLSIQQIADTLHMSTFVAHGIVTEDLQMRKVCAKLVPKVLTQDQKVLRVLRCQELLNLIKNEPDFLNSVVTGDESWMFEYDPESKRQSCAWHTKSSPRPKKARMSKSRIKTMIIVFFDIRGIVHCEFVPQGQTVNSAFYLEVLRRLKRRITRVRTDIKDTVKLHHDNATSHTAFIITNFLARSNTPVIPHPPYSPDLAPLHVVQAMIIMCDASKDAMGAALLQEDRPLAFASASFSDSQKQYSQIEKELLSVYYGCKKFEYLLSGHTFVVQTDHQPLLPLVKKPLSDISPRLQRLVMKLIAFDFKLQYKPGKYLIVADTLSRDTHPMDELPTPFLEDKRMVKMVRVNISDEKLVAMQKDTREDPALNQLPPPQKLNIRSATVQRWASHPQPRYSGQVKRPILTRGKARLHPLGLHQNHPEGPGFQVGYLDRSLYDILEANSLPDLSVHKPAVRTYILDSIDYAGLEGP
ncbi:hypothetical protein LAZ67_1000570 [Cordylochernes scorpioides]|uniref:Reverse transcriptase RNase H-like domain-containing protein n=1 Tax=Cordylochernes scorpioides TaxID=51811 RepID=A0ABY6JXY0_9ARAC|nr:hypothetical protein LAZ67_1000570 [Cordylochernes scorpioides]